MLPRANGHVEASAWTWLPCCFLFSSTETAAVTVSDPDSTGDPEILQPRPLRATLERPQPWLASGFQVRMLSELSRDVELG